MIRVRALHSQGFTLLELLIALAVFAVLATMAYGVLRNVLHTQQTTEDAAARLQQIQQAIFYLYCRSWPGL